MGRVMLTVFIEVDPRYNSVKPLLEDQWTDERKNAMGVTEFKSRIEGEMGRVDYVQTKAAEKTISLRNAHAYWVVDGCWIDVHVSIANFKPEEEQLFKLLFDTAVIYNGSDRGSLKELFHANALYYQKDYKKAAAAYESLLFGERLAQTLDTDRLRMATDNLGMAYGQLGDLKKSQATYETAIKQDPEYSGYHYNLACTLAEMDKLDEAIAELRLAYQFIANQIEGEKLPNPRTDDSFKRFMKNDKFLKALAEMEKGK